MSKLDPKTQEAVDTLTTLVVNAVGGTIQLGMMEGLKLKGALDVVRQNKAASQVWEGLLDKLWRSNPELAMTVLRGAVARNPKLIEFLKTLVA